MNTYEIDIVSAKELINKGEARLIDIREQSEYDHMHIPSASLKPLSVLNLTDYVDEDGVIIFHCQSGRRSMSLLEKLHALYPNKKFYSLKGGISAWRTAGYDIVEKTNTISIIRQVMIVVGSLTLLGAVASIFIDDIFICIPIIMSCGLLYAGLSGNCMMASLLSQCPWNK